MCIIPRRLFLFIWATPDLFSAITERPKRPMHEHFVMARYYEMYSQHLGSPEDEPLVSYGTFRYKVIDANTK